MRIRIAGLADDSIVDGPGLRFTVFTQGCPHRCEGCHNPETHDFLGGRDEDTQAILRRIAANRLLSGITLSGGEPFAQAAACAHLARGARALGLNVWIYSGYTFEQLLAGPADWRALLEECDVLVDGRFELALRSLSTPYRGSKNQRLIDLPASLSAGRAVERAV
ncbi:MAG: anaerobic ribonucleoside-triphosphate reductase activating protein [Clostridiales bacterium]|nr:anaerobic ribonucleoside-triphosphate reductase activating protein [Clostridiales bacterium]